MRQSRDSQGKPPEGGRSGRAGGPGVPDDPRAYLPGGDPQGVNRAGILAYFADAGAAERAARQLREAGLGPVSVDRVMPQAVDAADLAQRPFPRVDTEDHLEAGMPLDPRTRSTTLVAVAAEGEAAERALRILRGLGGSV